MDQRSINYLFEIYSYRMTQEFSCLYLFPPYIYSLIVYLIDAHTFMAFVFFRITSKIGNLAI